MTLDINPEWVTFNFYSDAAGHPSQLQAQSFTRRCNGQLTVTSPPFGKHATSSKCFCPAAGPARAGRN